MVAEWPRADAAAEDPAAREEMETLIAIITKIRNIRSIMNVPVSAWLKAHFTTTDERAGGLISANIDSFKRLARVESVSVSADLPAYTAAARDIVAGIELAIPLEGVIDLEKERARIGKEIARKEEEAAGMAARLSNPAFADRAPQDVVEQTRTRHNELMGEVGKLKETLQALGA
jgi:valyl-tRNA synthetase